MKKRLAIAQILVLLSVLISACGGYGGYPEEDCQANWDVIIADAFLISEEIVMEILNTNWPPDSVGYIVQTCINEGWDGWRTQETEQNTSEESQPAEITPPPTKTSSTTVTPSPTQEPTYTPEPTEAPDPVDITGTGDSVVDIDWPETLGLMIVKGNSAGRFFAVIPYDESGNRMSSLVNTTDPYEGKTPFNFGGEFIARLEISAIGEWSIRIIPLSEGSEFSIPGNYEGSGNDVIILTGGIPDLATISGNSSGRYFGVISYTVSGRRLGSIVNTTDPYEGSVIIPRDTGILEVISIDDWTITITTAN